MHMQYSFSPKIVIVLNLKCDSDGPGAKRSWQLAAGNHAHHTRRTGTNTVEL